MKQKISLIFISILLLLTLSACSFQEGFEDGLKDGMNGTQTESTANP